MGVWKSYPLIAIIAAISIVITASYIIRVVGRVFYGNMPAEFEGHIRDVTILDKIALVFLSFILIALGVFPGWMVPLVESGVDTILRLLGGA